MRAGEIVRQREEGGVVCACAQFAVRPEEDVDSLADCYLNSQRL